MGEMAELGQRIGEARDGRLRKPGAFGDLAIAEQAFGRRECAQHFEAARQGRHEFAVAMRCGARSLGGRDLPGLMTGFQSHDAVSLPACARFI